LAIGRTRGGLGSKTHIAVDTLEQPLRLVLTAGEVHESALSVWCLRHIGSFKSLCGRVSNIARRSSGTVGSS